MPPSIKHVQNQLKITPFISADVFEKMPLDSSLRSHLKRAFVDSSGCAAMKCTTLNKLQDSRNSVNHGGSRSLAYFV